MAIHGVHPEQFAMPTNPAWHNSPAAGVAAVVAFAAQAGHRQCVYKPVWSYDALLPTGGRLQATSGGMVVFDVYITNGGPGFLPVEIEGLMNQDLTVTIAAVAGVSGTINVEKHWFRTE